MPSTVLDLFKAADLVPMGAVRWQAPVREVSAGVYVVSLSDGTSSCTASLQRCPLADDAIQRWLEVCPNLQLDGMRPTVPSLKERLAEFWLPDEEILYIGLATSLRSRVGSYYRTPLGASRPHAGGHFLKTLNILSDLFVHYAVAGEPKACEQKMLGEFCRNVTLATKTMLRDPDRPFPFANLEYPPGTRKRHGLSGGRV